MKGPLARLYADHDALGVRLDALEALRGSDVESAEALNGLGAALREEIEVHSRREEAVLFPALAARGFAPDLLRGLAADHEALRKALLAFTRARAAAGDWRRPAGHIVAMLRTHMRIENERIFPYAAEWLPAPELARVAAGLNGPQ